MAISKKTNLIKIKEEELADKVVYRSRGVSTLGLLGVLFVGLKLGGLINWSWWLVLLPFYGVAALFLTICLFALLCALVVAMCTN